MCDLATVVRSGRSLEVVQVPWLGLGDLSPPLGEVLLHVMAFSSVPNGPLAGCCGLVLAAILCLGGCFPPVDGVSVLSHASSYHMASCAVVSGVQ